MMSDLQKVLYNTVDIQPFNVLCSRNVAAVWDTSGGSVCA